MEKWEIKSNMISKIVVKIAILQIIALLITCSIGIYMTEHKLYTEQFYLVLLHIIFIFLIIKLNDKLLTKVDNL